MTLLVLIGCSFPAEARQAWTDLPNAPFTSRHNDLYFVAPDTGWVVNGNGEIYKTLDGGDAWSLQLRKNNAHFRSVGFVNSQRGWAGNVGDGEFGATDPSAIYETADGGATWQPIGAYNGQTPKGICGINVLSDSVVTAVGRVRGPAFFARTTDAGVTWRSKSMSTYAAGLIDVHFFTPDSGFAVGLTNVDHEQSRGLILFTADGGDTWEQRFVSSRTGEWAWKMSFPSRNVGYVSLQRNTQTPIFFLKTTDGGETWEEKLFSSSYYFVQGLGFVTEDVGWIGGNSSFPTYVTTDGGDSWASADFGIRVNRLRFLGDTLGYAAGRSVYKYENMTSTAIAEDLAGSAATTIGANYPNPFRKATTFDYTLAQSGRVTVEVLDVVGRRIRTLFDGTRSQGHYELEWDGLDAAGNPVSSGVYLYSIETDASRASRAMILNR